MKRYLVLVFFCLAMTACNPPSNVSHTIVCGGKEENGCVVRVTNNEAYDVMVSLDVSYEEQGADIIARYKYPDTEAMRLENWERPFRNFFQAKDSLLPGETKSFKVTIPETSIGQTLIRAHLWVDAPTRLADYGDYNQYTLLGQQNDPQVHYEMKCDGGTATITIENVGLKTSWFGVYRNEDLDTAWQSVAVNQGQTVTFTAQIPADTYLLEVDFLGHADGWKPDRLDHHGARAYCLPGAGDKK